MSRESVPTELLAIRDRIDAVDTELVALLARRFKLTHQVGMLKAASGLPALDTQREAEKLDRLRQLAEAVGLNPELVAELFARIMQEAVTNHRRLQPD